MKKFIFILVISFFVSNVFGEVLIQTELKPNENFKKIKSLILFPFDSRLINSGRSELIDSIKLSDDLFEYMLKKFQETGSFIVSSGKGEIEAESENRVKILRSKQLNNYDEKVINNNKIISHSVDKTIDAILYGNINRYYTGKDLETSYIEVTIYLVDSKSKVVYWTSKIKGCLKYVVQTIVGTIVSGEYTEPTVKESGFHWVNPYLLRPRDFAIEYDRGYYILLAELSDKVENDWGHTLGLYFKSPIFANKNIYNRIDLSLLPSFKSKDKSNSFYQYQYYTFLPLTFSFIYNFTDLINMNGLRPYVKLGLGVSYDVIYYTGYTYEIESKTELNGVLNFGVGAEYFFDIGSFNIWKMRVSIKRLGATLNVSYMKWLTSYYANLNISLGLKYYW